MPITDQEIPGLFVAQTRFHMLELWNSVDAQRSVQRRKISIAKRCSEGLPERMVYLFNGYAAKLVALRNGV